MNDRQPSWDADSVAARTRTLWREARDRHRGRLDVYVKTASRVRVSRRPGDRAEVVSRALECGTAVRLVMDGAPRASFAACTGMSVADLRWVIGAAESAAPGFDAAMPAPAAFTQSERRDLDPPEPFPGSDELVAWLASNPDAVWIECGSTIEALAGDEGWLTLRRRNRVWALLDDGGRSRLLARRGYRLDDPAPSPPRAATGDDGGLHPGRWLLEPGAAASLISALGRGVHGDTALLESAVAPEWRLEDDPMDPSALFGGAFDDAGFPASRRVIADGGRMTSALDGPGTLRRTSYRDAPSPAHAHLVFRGRPAGVPEASGRRISRCRVVPLDRDAWLLVMEAIPGSGAPLFLTVAPGSVPRSCSGTWGRPVLSAEGVLAAGLVLDLDPA